MTESEFWQACDDPSWRLSSLYHIVGKGGTKIRFTPNWAQSQLLEDIWYCNIILKARQIGISTLICLLFLDRCLFNHNMAAGIICQTARDSEQMFKRIKFAYNHLPNIVKMQRKCHSDSANEMIFDNGSSIRVGTLMRGYTLQYLHISEFGKICAEFPDKAEEIVSGSLQTVAPGQYIFIESTAEGREGRFYEMCKYAENMQKMGCNLTKLDYRFHFFPWWKEPNYREGGTTVLTQPSLEYFDSLEQRGIKIDPEQKNWYARKHFMLEDMMRREYPSTSDEAWESSINGAYYAQPMALVRAEKRILFLPYDKTILVHTAWDLGFNDATAIWFFQICGKEIHLLEYIEGSGESLSHWLAIVKEKKYCYGKHLAPHDIMTTEFTSGLTRQAAARKMGVNFVPSVKADIIPGIDACRAILPRCFFDEAKCARGIVCLENYKKRWNERTANWSSEPLHNEYSHGADAFRTLATGLGSVVNTHSGTDINLSALGFGLPGR